MAHRRESESESMMFGLELGSVDKRQNGLLRQLLTVLVTMELVEFRPALRM
jgi:hypothetical protein